MRLISSRITFLYKFVFPLVWFGILGSVSVGALLKDEFSNGALLIPVGMMIFGYFTLRRVVFDLVNQVWDDGDALVVKNRGEEERILLADIADVSYSIFVNPPRVVLTLRRQTVFGERIAFCAPVQFMPFTRSAEVTDLIDRIDRTRRK